MQQTISNICVDRIVPPELEDAAYEIAIKENDRNESPFEAAGLHTKRWEIGRDLHIAFLEGSAKLQQEVARSAQEWCKYANIKFLFDNSAQAEIRIAFESKGRGSQSLLGTDARLPLFDGLPTMNFDLSLIVSDEWLAATVLHEFGHALGLVHEHQSPASGIYWNKPAVIKYFSGPPNNWNQEQVEANIFRRYNALQTLRTPFDPHSIMIYPIVPEWTLDGFEVQMNTALSQSDKQFIRYWYPTSV